MAIHIQRRRRLTKKSAPAIVHFGSAAPPEGGGRKLCVWVSCEFTHDRVGPIWGHREASVKAALAELTRKCRCPANFHRAMEYRGKRIGR